MQENEFLKWQFYSGVLRTLFPKEEFKASFFRQFKPRFIWNRDRQKLERCIKVGDIGKYIADRLKNQL